MTPSRLVNAFLPLAALLSGVGLVCIGLMGWVVAEPAAAQAPSAANSDAAPPTPEPQGDDIPEGEGAPQTDDPPVTTAGVGQLQVELDPQEITVGDVVTATLSLVWMGAEPAEAPRFPTWQDTWGNAEVLQTGEVESRVDDSGRRLYSQQLRLTSFQVGDVSMPVPTVVIPLGDRSVDVTAEAPSSFQVISVLPPEAQEDAEADPAGADSEDSEDSAVADADDTSEAAALEPKPAADPRALQGGTTFAVTAAALGLLNLLAGGLLVRRLQRAGRLLGEAPEPWVPPLEALLGQLDRVDPNGESEPVHTAISLALRRYLSRHLSWNAAGSTTSEIQRQLRTARVTPAMTQSLVQLFKDCDQVKFARQEVSPSVNADRLARAREMGRSLEVFLAPKVTPESDASQDGAPPSTPVAPTTSRQQVRA